MHILQLILNWLGRPGHDRSIGQNGSKGFSACLNVHHILQLFLNRVTVGSTALAPSHYRSILQNGS